MPVSLRVTLTGVVLLISTSTIYAEGVVFPSSIGVDALSVEDEALSTDDVSYCSELKDCVGAGGAPAKKAAPKPSPCATSHKGVFYLNDFSYLDDPANGCHCLGDSLKRMPLGDCGEWGTLDVGGQLRLRYHHEEGMGNQPGRLGFEDTVNDFLLTRFRLYSDWRAN